MDFTGFSVLPYCSGSSFFENGWVPHVGCLRCVVDVVRGESELVGTIC